MIEIMLNTFIDHLHSLNRSRRTLGRGALVFERDDPVRNYYLVSTGEVHLLRRQEDGSAVIMQRAGVGMLLAESSFTAQHYHCSAVTVSESELLVFKKADVQKLLADDASAAHSLILYLTQEMQRTRKRAEILSLRRVEDRVSAWLIWNDGQLPVRGQWLGLAAEIGVSPEALYRELARRRDN